MLHGGDGYCAAKSLYPDAKSFCEAVAMDGDEDYGKPEQLGALDYLIAHTRIGYAHHCGGYPEWGYYNERSSWWQIEDEPGRGRSPVWYLDLS